MDHRQRAQDEQCDEHADGEEGGGGHDCLATSERGSNLPEQAVQGCADHPSADDDHDCDKRSDQAILNSGDTVFFTGELLDELNELHGACFLLVANAVAGDYISSAS
jgi:hypothetical protein